VVLPRGGSCCRRLVGLSRAREFVARRMKLCLAHSAFMPRAAKGEAPYRVPAVHHGVARGETSQAFTSHAPLELFPIVVMHWFDLGG